MRLAAAFSFVVSALLAVAAPQTTAPAPSTMTINTPVGVAQCSNTLLTWSGGTGPYQIQVLPGGQPSAAPLEDLGSTLTGTTLTWLCKIPANTQIFFRLKDTSNGLIVESGTVTVLAGDTACTTAAPSSNPGASTPAASSAPGTTPAATTPAATTPAATTPAGSTPTTSAGSNTGTSKAASNTSKTSSSAASSPTGGVGQLEAPVVLAGAAALAMAVFA